MLYGQWTGCQKIRVDKQQSALAIFDHFRGQIIERVTKELDDDCVQNDDSCIHSVHLY